MQAKHPAGHTSMMKSKDHMMMRRGGPVKGPGTGTSDSIPIMASHGEYMMPADSVKKIGVKVLDAMKDATHKPVKDMPKMGARKGMANGGMPMKKHMMPEDKMMPRAGARKKPMKMVDGGLIEDERQAAAPVQTASVKAGAGVPANLFTFRVPENVKASVQQGLDAVRGATPVGGAAPGFAETVSARVNDLTGTAAPPAANPTDQRLAAGAQTAQPVGDPMAPAGGFGAGRGSVNPPMATATGDARPDLAGIPSLGGSTGTAVAGADGVRKFKTADGRTLYSNVPGADNDTLMSDKPGVQIAPSAKGPDDPVTAMAGGSGRDMSPKAIYERASAIYASMGNGPSSSSGNRSGGYGVSRGGGVSAQNMAAADALAARYGADARSAALGQQYDQEVDDAAATNMAGGFGTGRKETPRSMLLGRLSQGRLTAKGAGVLATMEQSDARSAATAATNRIAEANMGINQARLGVERGRATTEQQSKAALIEAQNAFVNARTPEEKNAAAQALAVLQGRVKETPDLFDRVQTGVDPATNAPIFSIYSKRTGQVQGPAGAKPAIAEGSISTVNGKTAKYIGGKWVPQ